MSIEFHPRETKLQLILSPVLLRSGALSSKGRRTDGDGLLSQGHLLLTGLQFRGHGMFSELDRPLGADTVEYAWLIEVSHRVQGCTKRHFQGCVNMG